MLNMHDNNPVTIKSGAVGAIIVAAGRGSRMGLGYNKVFADLHGRPVLDHTINAFARSGLVGTLILAINPDDEEKAASLCMPYKDDLKIIIAHGGAERQDSVYNGLRALPEDAEIVLIHDGARPFIDRRIIEDSVSNALIYGAACAGVPAKDTIKIVDDSKTIVSTPERSTIWQAQTPQSFKKDIIISAYEYACKNGIRGTDDASIAEKAGFKVVMFEGSYRNIKLTSPEDFRIAEHLV